MKVIADTNIIISALISRKGKESDIILNPNYRNIAWYDPKPGIRIS